MAKKPIQQKIELSGGEAIRKQLRELGQAGERAFKQIKDAADRAKTPGAALAKSLEQMRVKFKELGNAGRRLRGSLSNLGSSIGRLGASAATVAKRVGLIGLAAAGAGAALLKMARTGTEAVDFAAKQSQVLGLSVEAFGRLQFASEQAGVKFDELRTAFARLNRTVSDARNGNEAAAASFRELGIDVTSSSGQLKTNEEIIGEIADVLSKMPDGAEKSALAIQLLGESGARLVPLLNGGSEGLRELGDEAERLGIVFTAEQAKIGEAMNDALNALGRASRGVTSQLGLLFAPTITEAANALTDLIVDNRAALEDLAKRGLAIAVPLAKDFIAAITGRDQDVQSQWILDLRDRVISFAEAVTNAISGIIIPAYNALIAAADKVAGVVNNIFGTEFTGQEIIVAGLIAKLVGAFGLLAAAIGTVSAAVKVVVASFGLIAPAVGAFASIFGVIVTGAKAALAVLAGLVSWPALLVAAVAAAAVAIVVYWDEIKAAAVVAFSALADAARSALEYIISRARATGELFVRAWDAIRSGAESVFAAVVDLASSALSGVLELFDGAFSGIWDGIVDGANAAWEALIEGVRAVVGFIVDAFNGAVNIVEGAWNRIKSIASAARKAAASVASAVKSAGSSVASAVGFASGGHVRGPGTGTSDSIIARLSNGEFVIRAEAVKHYGTDLLHAINSMRAKLPGYATGGPVSNFSTIQNYRTNVSRVFGRVWNDLPGYASGGVVSVAPAMPRVEALVNALAGMSPQVPAFAVGGEVQAAGRPLSFTLPGGEVVDGLTATPDAAEQLIRYATNRRVRSAGRKPGWVR